ncbi:MAG: hypothetical protein KKD44_13845 [Proteobacteria bacterium]|nr:hypothetical protein [Pseudomonadota bacterium]
MFPFIFEWVWDSGHYIFFGAMWYVICILTVGLTYCLVKTVKDTLAGDNDHH